MYLITDTSLSLAADLSTAQIWPSWGSRLSGLQTVMPFRLNPFQSFQRHYKLKTLQARIESNIQSTFPKQQVSKTPIISRSLDASSREGRQMWTDSGAMLRNEDIPPAIVQEDRGVIVNAMKSTFMDKEVVSARSISKSCGIDGILPLLQDMDRFEISVKDKGGDI